LQISATAATKKDGVFSCPLLLSFGAENWKCLHLKIIGADNSTAVPGNGGPIENDRWPLKVRKLKTHTGYQTTDS
jgi:hypothetical protein